MSEEGQEARDFMEQIAQNKLRNQAMLQKLGITDLLRSQEAEKFAAEKERWEALDC